MKNRRKKVYPPNRAFEEGLDPVISPTYNTGSSCPTSTATPVATDIFFTSFA